MTGRRRHYTDPTWLGRQGTWTTDADGRFEVRGVGRDRIIGLELGRPRAGTRRRLRHGPAVANAAQAAAAAVGQVAGHDDDIRPTAPSAARRRDLRADRRPEQADRRRRPDEGDGPARGRDHRHGDRAGDADLDLRQDRRRTGRFRLVGLPKAGVVSAPHRGPVGHRAVPQRPRLTVTDTEGLKPIETTIEVPRGVIVTGRADRPGDRPARPGQARQLRQAADEPERRVSRHGSQRRGRPDVPADRPARRGADLRQRAAGRRRPIPGPASARTTRARGSAASATARHRPSRSTAITPTRSSTSRPTPSRFHRGSRADPRPHPQGPAGRSRRQAGRRCAMLWTRARPGASSRRSPTRPSRSTAWSRAILARSSSRTRIAGWSARSSSRTRTSRARRRWRCGSGRRLRQGPAGRRGRPAARGRHPLGHDRIELDGTTTCRPARRRCGPTTRPSPPTPTAGSRSIGLKPGVKSFIGVQHQGRDRISGSTPARSSATSCPSGSARSATWAR